jgi:hypothetical protein
MFSKKLGLATAAATLTFAGAAVADDLRVSATSTESNATIVDDDRKVDVVVDMDDPIDGAQEYGLIAPKEAPISRVGTMLQVGAGATNFTENGPQAVTNPGMAWDVRAVLGSRSLIGLEGAYVGSLQDVEAPGLDNSAMLASNGVEGALRINAPVTIGDGLVSPYGFGGIGYKRYSIAWDNGSTSASIAQYDDTLTLPVGVGLSAGLMGVTLDARATYRQTFMTEIVGDSESSWDSTSLNHWQLGGGLGFEF